jgi:glycosyltransferase involved in cell wall biosynthesis
VTIRVIVDGRCLQDPDYATRGVGQHVRALLRHRYRQSVDDLHLIAVLDRGLPPLTADDRALFEHTRTTAYVPPAERCLFLSTSPMTHSPLPMARLLMRPDVRRAALVYDFIPHDRPEQYLSSEVARLSYATCLAWLRRFDHYFPISQYTSRRLQELLKIDARRCTVTGVSVRETVTPANGVMGGQPGAFVLVVGGGDPRKNPDVAIAAHAASSRLAAAGIRLLIAGAYPEWMQCELRRLHKRAGGRADLLQFLPKVPDEELRRCYAAAVCTVAPSRIEGFSIPIVEASANGCPVLASNCAAQAELLTDAEDLFDPDDSERLRCRLEQLALDPSDRDRTSVRQADTWRRFTEPEVGSRFWGAVRTLTAGPAAAVLHGNRPRIAFLSPLPPAASGVADYSFATLGALAARADVEVFSDTAEAHVPAGTTLTGRTTALAHLDSRFDAVVSVIGNSDFHMREFELLLRYGAAAIAHDARMLFFYARLLGEDRALAAASDELGRPVAQDELHTWLADESRLQALYLKEIAEASYPMIVHSSITARLIADRYRIECARLPFVPYRTFPTDEISAAARAAARSRLGIGENEIIVASFGIVLETKGVEDCLRALVMLRNRRMMARLALVGPVDESLANCLVNSSSLMGIGEHLILFQRPVPVEEYRSWLVAADVAVQLRTYQLGGLSGALLDCIAAALPTVCNAHLAEAVQAPSYVHRVPDAISAVLIAEAIASVIEEGSHLRRPISERDAALATRNFDVYAERLLEVLGFE